MNKEPEKKPPFEVVQQQNPVVKEGYHLSAPDVHGIRFLEPDSTEQPLPAAKADPTMPDFARKFFQ